jgi:hypothetical protein
MSETLVRVPLIARDVAESMVRALKESLRAFENTGNTSSMRVISGSREIPGKSRVSFARPANWRR